MNCIKCNKTAQHHYSPDIDVKGIGMCNECKDEVFRDIKIAIIGNDWKHFKKKYLK